MFATWLAVCASIGCGGALDREDGALLIRLVDVPVEIDAVRATVVAGGRTFEATIPPPVDGVVRDFTAIPAGPALVDLELYAGPTLLLVRRGLDVMVTVDAVIELEARFSNGPEFDVEDPGEGSAHAVHDGPIRVVVTATDPAVQARLTLRANDQDISVVSTGVGWFAEIEPSVAGEILPASIELEFEVCVEGAVGLCAAVTRRVTVHRRAWSLHRDELGPAPPIVTPSGTIVFGQEPGGVGIVDATGQDLWSVGGLGDGVASRIARAGDVVVTANDDGLVSGVSTTSGQRLPWHVTLGARPTAPASDGVRVVIGAGRRLVAIDPMTGVEVDLEAPGGSLRATPLADGAGVVAADLRGEVVSLDAMGAVRFRASLGEAVVAAPIRAGDDIIIATIDGTLRRLAIDGTDAQAPLDLGAAVALRPAVIGGSVVIAAGRDLAWVDDQNVRTVAAGAPITGAPQPFLQGVVVGLANGLVLYVRPDGMRTIVSRLPAAAFEPVVLTAPDRILIGSSSGDLQMLRLESEFGQ